MRFAIAANTVLTVQSIEGIANNVREFTMNARLRYRLLAAGVVASLLGLVYWLIRETNLLEMIQNGAVFREWLVGYGAWGPAIIIGLMMTAILVSPIPSAPIAVAAGAAYGHLWGTVYVLFGAEIGALAAFGIARLLGSQVLQRWLGDRLSVGWLGSQNSLMGIVFFSRLVPFVSFDLISYAAGLTVLSFWRFAIATAIGIVPASFLLAHFGDELATGETESIGISILVLGTLTVIPLLINLYRKRFRDRNRDTQQ